jgi:hypothetical protein
MSMNKAIHQVIMHEQIGGNKQAPPRPIKPVKMPDPRNPEGSGLKKTIHGYVPPPPPPTDGGAEVTPPEGLPESMKAFWKQRLVNQIIENQLIERKQVGVITKVVKKVAPYVVAGGTEEVLPVGGSFDPWGWFPDPFLSPNQSVPYDEMNPNGYPYNNQGQPEMPAGTQGTGQWAGPNVPGGGGVAV